jgi:hypothetical protein
MAKRPVRFGAEAELALLAAKCFVSFDGKYPPDVAQRCEHALTSRLTAPKPYTETERERETDAGTRTHARKHTQTHTGAHVHTHGRVHA